MVLLKNEYWTLWDSSMEEVFYKIYPELLKVKKEGWKLMVERHSNIKVCKVRVELMKEGK